MRGTPERLYDIQVAINRILKYTSNGRREFDESELVQEWVVRQIEIIGEAVINLPATFKTKYPNVSWKQIGAMRNILIHQYFHVDYEVVWATVEHDIPILKSVVDANLREEDIIDEEDL